MRKVSEAFSLSELSRQSYLLLEFWKFLGHWQLKP